MVKQYRTTVPIRFFNKITSLMARRGVGRAMVMTTIGSRTGEPRQVPISPIVLEGVEYVVAPYGLQSAWVGNVRANPHVTLIGGGAERQATLEEVTGTEAATAALAYYQRDTFSRPYIDVPDSPTVEDFRAVADQVPVFRVAAPPT